MKKLVVLFTFLWLGFAGFSTAADISVGGEMFTLWLNRIDYDLDNDASGDVGMFRQDLELDFTFKLTDTVRGVIDLRTSNLLVNNAVDANNVMHVKQAYIGVKEFFYKPLSLKIGKQVLHYSLRGDGNALWLGYQACNSLDNPGRDLAPVGFKGTFDYDNLSVDVFTVKYLESAARTGDLDVHGLNVDYWLSEDSDSLINVGFGLVNDDNSAMPVYAMNADKSMVGVFTAGVDYFLLDNALELAGDFGIQFGKLGEHTVDQDLFAYAFDLTVCYNFHTVRFAPWLELSASVRSGENDDNDKSGAWQALFENNDKTLLVEANNCISLYNLNSGYYAIRLAGGGKFTAKFSAKTILAVYGDMTDDSLAANAVGVNTDDNMIGFEWDVCTKYSITKNLFMCPNFGVFFPGNATEAAGQDSDPAIGFMFKTQLNF